MVVLWDSITPKFHQADIIGYGIWAGVLYVIAGSSGLVATKECNKSR